MNGLDGSQLVVGSAAGFLALGSLWLAPALRRHASGVLAVAAALALVAVDLADPQTLVALGLLAVVPCPPVAAVAVGLGAVGGAAVMSTLSGGVGVAEHLALAMTVGAGTAMVADVITRRGHRVAAALMAVTVAAVFAAVPDTEVVLVLGSALAPAVAATVVLPVVGDRQDRAVALERLSPAPVAALVTVVVWVVAEGSADRAAATVGGVACLGLLAIDPVTTRIVRVLRHETSTATDGLLREVTAQTVALVLLHVAVAGVAARWAASRPEAGQAIFVAAGLAVGSALVMVGAGLARPRARAG